MFWFTCSVTDATLKFFFLTIVVFLKVLSLLEACFDLISLTFHENSNHGRENYWKSGVQMPAPEGQIFFVHFSCHIFKFFTQNCVSLILAPFWYLIYLIRNQIKHVENLCLYWYMICKRRYSKMVTNKDIQFFMENLKMKRKKGQKCFDLLERGFVP